MFLLAAHTTHSANFERKVPDQAACGQLVNLQNILDIVEIIDQQVALVHAGGKTCRQKVMDKYYSGCVVSEDNSRILKQMCVTAVVSTSANAFLTKHDC